jgi:hypothetical protein
MSREDAKKIIEETKADYSIPQNFLKGLEILSKYDDNIDPAFDHDIIWASDFDATVENMTKEEVIQMATYGWFEDEDSWAHF